MKRTLVLQMLLAWVMLAGFFGERGMAAAFDEDKWKGAPSDWEVKAELESGEYRKTKAIPLRLTMRNVTNTGKWIVSVYPFADFWIEVRDAQRTMVPYTELVAKLRGPTQAFSVRVACSPKTEPGAMRVRGARAPPNSPHETQTTHP